MMTDADSLIIIMVHDTVCRCVFIGGLSHSVGGLVVCPVGRLVDARSMMGGGDVTTAGDDVTTAIGGSRAAAAKGPGRSYCHGHQGEGNWGGVCTVRESG